MKPTRAPTPDLPEHRILLTFDEVRERVVLAADFIRAEYRNTRPHLLVVLHGAFYFGADLSRQLDIDHTFSFIEVSSYGPEDHSSGYVSIGHETTQHLDDQDVIIVEDIVDTGLTVTSLVQHLETKHHPSSISLVTLLNRSYNTVVALPLPKFFVSYQLETPNFLVGYGLDYQHHYRHLPHITEISPTQPNKNTTTTKHLKRH